MTNLDSSTPQYEYEWQNPDKKTFDVGRVVSNTFKVLRQNLAPFFILTFFGVGIPVMLFSMWPLFLGVSGGINIFDATWVNDIEWEGVLGFVIIGYLAYMVLYVVMYGAIIQMTVNGLNDRAVNLRSSMISNLKIFFPLLAVFILYFSAMIVGTLLFIIPGILIALGWAFSIHVKIIEEETILGSLSRSWDLSKGYKRWILLMMIIFGVLGAVIGLVFQIPVLLFGSAQTAIFEGGSLMFWVANGIGTGLSQMVTVALSCAGLTATYLEVRRVKEGADFDKIADIFS